MSYEPTNWKDGDLVTSAKLNKIEQGIANGSGGTLIVHLTWSNDGNTATMDKTWQQVYDADSVVVLDRYEEDGEMSKEYSNLHNVAYENSQYFAIVDSMRFNAETSDSYPIWNHGT